ncbi:MAG TPA: hypothetical protein ENJ31_13520 [Anaerolineae bacterium]|nr:hypothetical protein [Anaerolineae bacterium]
MIITTHHTPDLARTLRGLGISAMPADGNGHGPQLRVEMNHEADARLEALIDALSELRWQYEPGRAFQLRLPMPPEEQP